MTLARGTACIDSARLTLRRIAPDDLPFFTRIHAIADVVRYTGHGLPRSAEESRQWLRSTLASYDEFELGQLAVVRKSDGALLGRCGLSDFVMESTAYGQGLARGWFSRTQAPAGLQLRYECELGYTFDTAAWGQGYASEAATCVFAYARDVRRIPRVISVIRTDNVRSLRLAQRCGLRQEGQVEVVGRGVHALYEWPISGPSAGP